MGLRMGDRVGICPCFGSAKSPNRDHSARSNDFCDKCGVTGFKNSGDEASVSPYHVNVLIFTNPFGTMCFPFAETAQAMTLTFRIPTRHAKLEGLLSESQ